MARTEDVLGTMFRINLQFNSLNKEAERTVGLSIAQWCVVNRIREMPASPAQKIAEALGVHPSTLTQSLKLLDGKGLIYIASDPRDSRKKLVSLSRKGFEVIEASRSAMAKFERRLEAISASLESVRSHLSGFREEKSNTAVFLGSTQ